MGKTITIILLVFVATILIFAPGLAQSDGESVVIIPYLSDPEIHIYSNQEVILGARWGACSRGLAQAARSSARLGWTMDGETLFSSQKEVKQHWGPSVPEDIGDIPCIAGDGMYLWRRHWRYSIGELDPGDYEIRLHYWLARPTVDGADYDGDGRPDIFVGTLVDIPVSVLVVDPPD